MPQTVDQFAESLVAAGLATADEIKSLWETLSAEKRPEDAETFSKLLVGQGTITEFQAQELLSGSPRPWFWATMCCSARSAREAWDRSSRLSIA